MNDVFEYLFLLNTHSRLYNARTQAQNKLKSNPVDIIARSAKEKATHDMKIIQEILGKLDKNLINQLEEKYDVSFKYLKPVKIEQNGD